MKKNYFVLFLVFLSHVCFAQIFSRNLEEYKNIAEKTISSTANIRDANILRTKLSETQKRAIKETDKLALQIITPLLIAENRRINDDEINQETIQGFQNAIRLARNKEITNLEIYATISYAYYLYHFREMEKSLPLFLKASSMIGNIEVDEIIMPADTYKKLGFFFMTIGETQDAIHYLTEASKMVKHQTGEHAAIFDNLAVNYFRIEQYDKAKKLLEEALKISVDTGDEVRQAKVLGNMAMVNKNEKKYNLAIHQLQQDLELSKRNNSDQNTMFALILLSKVYLEKGDFHSAKKTITEAENYAKMKSYFKSSEYEITKILLEIAQKEGDKNSELVLLKKLDNLENTINKTDGPEIIQKINWKAQKEKIVSKLNSEQEKLRKAESVRNNSLTLLGLVIICFITGVLLFKTKRQQENEAFQSKFTELQNDKLKSEEKLNATSKNLANFTNFLNEKNSQIEDLEKELYLLRNSSSARGEKRKSQLQILLQSHLMTDDNWQNFKRTFIEEKPEYYQFLNDHFTTLTDSNLRLLMLMNLGLGNREIATSLGITQDAVKKAKQRLRKKYGEQYDMLTQKKHMA